MAETIEVSVGNFHANLHEQLEAMVGEQYEETVRNELESLIHDTYRELERAQEQQDALEQKADLEVETDE